MLSKGFARLSVALTLAVALSAQAQQCNPGTYSTSGSEPCNVVSCVLQYHLNDVSCCRLVSAPLVPTNPVRPLDKCESLKFLTDNVDSGATSCTEADPGSFAAGPGAVAEAPCPLGYYSVAGADSCTACPDGADCTSGTPVYGDDGDDDNDDDEVDEFWDEVDDDYEGEFGMYSTASPRR